jgi:small subunit ribosomal protein S20
MPYRHAAYKQIKKDKKRTLRNKAVKSELRTAIKKFQSLLKDKKLDQARTYLKELNSKITKAKSKGAFHKNTASRKVSRLYKELSRYSQKIDKTGA